MKLLIKSNEDIFGMSNVTGKYVKNPEKLPFSFYYSTKEGVSHGIRVKPIFNPEKMSKSLAGTLELHGNWEYTPGKNDTSIDSKKINYMINFFQTYKVLFAAVWEDVLPEDVIADYFKGFVTLEELIQEFYDYKEWSDILQDVSTVEKLEQVVRTNKLFNMND